MKSPFGPNLDAVKPGPMPDALRLTRSGRLVDAVAAIRDGLGGLTPGRARSEAPSRPDTGGIGPTPPITTFKSPFRESRVERDGAGGGAWRSRDVQVRDTLAQQRRRPAALQALRAGPPRRRGAAARGDAPRLHPVAGRLRHRHPDERTCRRDGLPRRLSRAVALGQRVAVLELVQAGRSAARRRRALVDRRDHPRSHARVPRGARSGLRGRALGRRRGGGDHGAALPRPLRRRRRAFRSRLRGGARHELGPSPRCAAGGAPAGAADGHPTRVVPTIVFHGTAGRHGQPVERRPPDRAGQGRPVGSRDGQRPLGRRHGLHAQAVQGRDGAHRGGGMDAGRRRARLVRRRRGRVLHRPARTRRQPAR